MNLEMPIAMYEEITSSPDKKVELPEDLKVTVMIDLCTKDLKEYLELQGHLTQDKVRSEIISYVERKRNQIDSQVKAMEVDNCEADNDAGKEQENWDNSWEEWQTGEQEEINYMNNPWGKGKGKGKGKKGGNQFYNPYFPTRER